MKFSIGKSIPAIVMACLVVALSTACTSYTNPLPVPDDLKADADLSGTWRSVDPVGDDDSYVQISVFPRPSGWVDMVIIDGIQRKSSKGIKVSTREGFSTSSGNRKFLCTRETAVDGQEGDVDKRSYILVHYALAKDGVLSIFDLEDVAIEKLIKNGTLKGRIEPNHLGSSQITVTSPSKELAEALAQEEPKSLISDTPLLKLKRIAGERN